MISKPNINIFIAYHKQFPIINTRCLIPIQVGRILSDEKLNMIGDDTGDNISVKNPNYCELTALYWMWKNVQADYYGLFHYRRFFNFKNTNDRFFLNFSNKTCKKFGWTDEDITRYCMNYDVVSAPLYDVHPPNESNKNISVYELFNISHNITDLDKTINIIKTKYPDYLKTAEEYLSQKKSSYFNMVIMKKEIFQNYCEWLFSILFELENRISISKNEYQSRVFGFIGERLLNIYLNNLRQEKKYHIKSAKSILEYSNHKREKSTFSVFSYLKKI